LFSQKLQAIRARTVVEADITVERGCSQATPAVKNDVVGISAVIPVLAHQRPVGGAENADAVIFPQRRCQIEPVGRKGKMKDDVGEAGNPAGQFPRGAVEKVDAHTIIGKSAFRSGKLCPPPTGHGLPVGRNRHCINSAFISLANWRPQDGEQSAGGQFPHPDALVVGAGHQIPVGVIHADVSDERRVHASFDFQNRLFGRLGCPGNPRKNNPHDQRAK